MKKDVMGFQDFARLLDRGDMNDISRAIDGIDLNQKAPAFHLPLFHIAVGGGNMNLIKLMLSKGADINIKGSDGADAMFVAGRRGDVDVIKFLVKKGVSVDTISDETTALAQAVVSGSFNAAKAMLAGEPDISVKTYEGKIVDLMDKSGKFKKIVKDYREDEEEIEFLSKTKKLGKYADLLR